MKSVAKNKAFTLTELLVAIGLLAAVLAASTMIFHYAIEAQRTAMATAEVMRNLRAITEQLNLNLKGLRTDGYLIFKSAQPGLPDDANHRDGLYFFSTGDFQSVKDDDVRSNIARIYFGPARDEPNNLLLDVKLLTPGKNGDDYNDVSFAECQQDIAAKFEDPNDIVDDSKRRPKVDTVNFGNLLAQRVGNMNIEWTDSTIVNQKIEWRGNSNVWTPWNQSQWPKALRFTFTLYDSKNIFRDGRTFEHIVYIGN